MFIIIPEPSVEKRFGPDKIVPYQNVLDLVFCSAKVVSLILKLGVLFLYKQVWKSCQMPHDCIPCLMGSINVVLRGVCGGGWVYYCLHLTC